ncbi:MAG: PLP-dependent transferase, partial [Sphingomonadales bacterium]|nr:PLP-dependent transferase [Sphingomonadales bacterium]
THHNMGPEGRAAMGVGDGMLRLNVGLEDPADLIADLDQALARAGL